MSSDDDRADRKKNANFWRAMRFLGPYRGMVIVSICCALTVGAVFTSGLGAMLPIFKVLLEDQTVADWADRQIVEHRLGVKLGERSDNLVITKVSANDPAAQMGLETGDALTGGLALASPDISTYQG